MPEGTDVGCHFEGAASLKERRDAVAALLFSRWISDGSLMFLGQLRISVLAAEILHRAGVRDGIGPEILDAGHDRPPRNRP
jgi:hypothetical protein